MIPYNTQQYNFHKYNFPQLYVPQLYIPQYCCITFHKDSQYSQWLLNPSRFPVVEPYSSGPGNGRGAHGQAGAAGTSPGIRERAAPLKGVREIARRKLKFTQITPRPKHHTEPRQRKQTWKIFFHPGPRILAKTQQATRHKTQPHPKTQFFRVTRYD